MKLKIKALQNRVEGLLNDKEDLFKKLNELKQEIANKDASIGLLKELVYEVKSELEDVKDVINSLKPKRRNVKSKSGE